MKTIPLGKFIEMVKAELLAYQEKHKRDKALFIFEEVELEASVGTTIDADGTVNIFAVQFGASGEQAFTHKVRIKLSIAPDRNKMIGEHTLTLAGEPITTEGLAPDDLE